MASIKRYPNWFWTSLLHFRTIWSNANFTFSLDVSIPLKFNVPQTKPMIYPALLHSRSPFSIPTSVVCPLFWLFAQVRNLKVNFDTSLLLTNPYQSSTFGFLYYFESIHLSLSPLLPPNPKYHNLLSDLLQISFQLIIPHHYGLF